MPTRVNPGVMSSATAEWATPDWLFDALNARFEFTLDVCASHWNHKCRRYHTQITDGLAQPWSPDRCWMNPPYGSAIRGWMEKAVREARDGALVVGLPPARPDTEWWHDSVPYASAVCFLAKRVKFVLKEPDEPTIFGDSFGRKKEGKGPAFPSAIIVWEPGLPCRRPTLYHGLMDFLGVPEP